MKWYLKMQNMFFFFASSDADALRAITLVRANIQPTFFYFTQPFFQNTHISLSIIHSLFFK